MTPADLDAAAAGVLSWLLTYAIHSTILLALAAVAAWRFADRHAWLDVIWKVALVAPLVTASLHLDPIALPLGGRWAMPTVTTVNETPATVPAAADQAPMAAAIAVEHATSPRSVDRVSTSDHAVPARAITYAAWQGLVRRWPSIAALAWLLIASFSVTWYSARLRRVYRALGSGLPVTASDLLDSVNQLRPSANQRRPIRLTTNAVCPVPLALAGRHIVLPERFMRELEPEQQRAALAHELAHVTRRDPEWRIAVEIMERALFFQPLNRLARARLCDSAEFLCDEWAVQQTQSPLALARCLSVVASWWSPAEALPAGVSAMARSDSAMVQRVTRILSEPARIARPRLHWLAIPVALVAIAAPRVTATQLPAAAVVPPAVAAVLGAAHIEAAADQAGAPPAIRSEAAEGLEHHTDPRSVEIPLKVAHTDAGSTVRAEAAETIVEVQPTQPKLDVSSFERIFIAGFIAGANEDVDANMETVRLLRSQLRNKGIMGVIDADTLPLMDVAKQSGGDSTAPPAINDARDLEQYQHIFANVAYWKRIGEEFQQPLIVTGAVLFAPQQRSGFVQREQESYDPSGRRVVVPVRTYMERKGFVLRPTFILIDGRTGETLHRETFREEILYNASQQTPALSSYLELMDRLLPAFLNTLSEQR